MPFTFRLEPLISIRDNVLKQKQAALAEAYEVRRVVEEQQSATERAIEQNLQASRDMMLSGNIDVGFLLNVRRHDAFLVVELETYRRQIVHIDEEIEVRRQAVTEANKELKIIEKLKEKKREQYLAEERRQETIEMDEIAGRRRIGN